MVRFRELSLSYNLPTRWVRALHGSSLSLTGAVRNLALWTRYTGGDPEVSGGGTAQGNINGTTTTNNDIRASGLGAVPLPRYWLLRLNIGL
jgi:hypothetical protein